MNKRFEVDRLPPHLRDLAHLDGAAVEVGIEQGHAERGPRRLLDRGGARQDQHLLGDLGSRNPDLAPGQHVKVAATLGPGLQPGRVEPGIGLGHRKAGFFVAGDQGRQKPALLLIAAEHDDRVQAENIHMDRRGAAEPGPGLGDRLHHHRRLADAEPAAAIFLRHGDAEPPARGHRPVKLARKAALLVLPQPIIVAKARAQPRDRLTDLLLLRAQGEAHLALRLPVDDIRPSSSS